MAIKSRDFVDGRLVVSDSTKATQILDFARRLRIKKQYLEALRYVDRAIRLFPKHYELLFPLWIDLLLEVDESETALAALQKIDGTFSSCRVETAAIKVLLTRGRPWAASERLQRALQSYCVTAGGDLERLAQQILESSDNDICGWVGVTENLDISGQIRGIPMGGGAHRHLEIRGVDNRILAAERIYCRPGQSTRFSVRKRSFVQRQKLQILVDGNPLIGSGLEYPPDLALDGHSLVQGDIVSGWISLNWNPTAKMTLRLSHETGKSVGGINTLPDLDATRQTFSFNWKTLGINRGELSVSAKLPDGSYCPLPDSPIVIDDAVALPPTRSTKVLRARAFRPTKKRKVDVIIPIFLGKEETLACIDSVMATLPKWAHLVLVDDASPDKTLSSALDVLAKDRRVTLLRNANNVGFPASVNRALILNNSPDAVLLNSDTIVFGDWLSRLRNAAYSAQDIGSVTPFTNKGTIASYPANAQSDPTNESAGDLDAFTRKTNQGATIDIPVGVGFCLYLRRDCLEDVGILDAKTFGKGYGEETDYCLRAARRGWRHILAADVFVRHAEGTSFGSRRTALQLRSAAILNKKFPEYESQLDEFAEKDPIHKYRRCFDEHFLRNPDKTYVLLITLNLSGGVDRFMAEHCYEIRKEGKHPLILMPLDGVVEGVRLWADDSKLQDLNYRSENDYGALRTLLTKLKITQIELHHFLKINPLIIDWAITLGPQYDVYIHDYIWICPRIRLIDESGTYCSEPVVSVCEACVKRNGSELQETITVESLRSRSARWLDGARNVIVPVSDVATRLRRYFPRREFLIKPWEIDKNNSISIAPMEGSNTRVVLIGGIGAHKGYDVLLQCALDAAKRRLRLEFIVVGHTQDDDVLLATGKVFVTGRYWENEVSALLRRERPHLAFYASVWPETWCYTLTHALRNGVPVIAFDIGAVAERLRSLGCGTLVPIETTPKDLNDHFIRIASTNANACRFTTDKNVYSMKDSKSKTMTNKKTVTPMTPNTLGASVNSVTLPQGLYYFSVATDTPASSQSSGSIPLPALQVTLAPGVGTDDVEFMSGPKTHGTWFYQPGNAMVARVIAPSATLILTSIRGNSGAELKLNIEKLDSRQARPSADISAVPLTASDSANPRDQTAERKNLVRLELATHIRGKGDIKFVDRDWAGRLGKGMWIEAFSIVPTEHLKIEDIEYKGLTASGFETPWLTNGAVCGTRGLGVPLIGFAVRLKANERTTRFVCEYSGFFGSGTTSGPFRNGTPCRSTVPNDSIEGIQIRITRISGDVSEVELTDNVPVVASKNRPSAIGPSFSRFRSDQAQEDEGKNPPESRSLKTSGKEVRAKYIQNKLGGKKPLAKTDPIRSDLKNTESSKALKPTSNDVIVLDSKKSSKPAKAKSELTKLKGAKR